MRFLLVLSFVACTPPSQIQTTGSTGETSSTGASGDTSSTGTTGDTSSTGSTGPSAAACATASTASTVVLMFLPKTSASWSDFAVARGALTDLGYTVELRSEGSAATFTGSPVDAAANTHSSYTLFTGAFQSHFGVAWNMTRNAPAAAITTQDIADVMSTQAYAALVIVGGIGATALSSVTSARLNTLTHDALLSGKPVLALSDAAALVTPLLVGQTISPGVHIGSASLTNCTNGRSRVIVTSNSAPQTTSHATRALGNIIETFPGVQLERRATKVLVIHGGAITMPCDAGTRTNDVPCNYPPAIPADYEDVIALLSADSASDEFNFTVDEVDITQEAVPTLTTYDAVLMFKHWNTSFTPTLQSDLSSFANGGGGIVAVHHGLYNDHVGGGSKNTFTALFGSESSSDNGWNPYLGAYDLIAVNDGHFVTHYGVDWPAPSKTITASPGATITNTGLYRSLAMNDEIYDTQVYLAGAVFGRGGAQITPLLTNDHTAFTGQLFTSGFVKRVGSGRLVFLQPGEKPESYTSTYGQLIRNALVYAGRR